MKTVKYSKYHPKLSKYERDLEENLEKSKPLAGEEKTKEFRKIKEATANYLRKEQRITIRLNSSDLERIKMMAVEEGLPYQTFIASMLHKLSTGRLQDVKQGKL